MYKQKAYIVSCLFIKYQESNGSKVCQFRAVLDDERTKKAHDILFKTIKKRRGVFQEVSGEGRMARAIRACDLLDIFVSVSLLFGF